VKTRATTRREFCAQACGAAGLAAVAGALQGCGAGGGITGASAPPLATVNGNAASGAVTVAIDQASPLAAVGSAALVRSGSGMFLVARTAQDTFTAVTSTCTHEVCTITGFEGQNYVCPCHGSRFDTSGGVVAGPATRPLRSFATRFSGGVLTITL
jgi:Rieske Fe-S protein